MESQVQVTQVASEAEELARKKLQPQAISNKRVVDPCNCMFNGRILYTL